MGPPAISLPENCQRNGEDGIAGLCHCVGHQEKCTESCRDASKGGLNMGELQCVWMRPLGCVGNLVIAASLELAAVAATVAPTPNAHEFDRRARVHSAALSQRNS
jgi:hypothetical protein